MEELLKGEDKKKKTSLTKKLESLGLLNEWDFALHLPIRYEDRTKISPICSVEPGQTVQLEGVVTHTRITKGRRDIFKAELQDDSGKVELVFFTFYKSTQAQLAQGKKVRVFGEIRQSGPTLQIIHPVVHVPGTPLPPKLTPVYGTTKGLQQPWLRNRIQTALLNLDIQELLTEEEREEMHLLPLRKSLETIHNPPPEADLKLLEEHQTPEWRRLQFDEYFAQQLVLLNARAVRDQTRAQPIIADAPEGSILNKFLGSLPFKLTGGQLRCWEEIKESLSKPHPMNRLVQGDVGSGKTIIAALAACAAIDTGMQAVLMAPTELLAEQHFKKILEWLSPLGIETVWLSGKMKGTEKKEALEKIKNGAPIVIGTHALIQPTVEYKNLGLAIVDEQHRFGVLQRLALRTEQNNGFVPHLLMLSATPIPRTLAMSYMADLDVSVIDELPPGRTPIETKLVRMERMDELCSNLMVQIKNGAQVYWVCHLVDESEKIDLSSAQERFNYLKAQMPQARIQLIHGQMDPEEKNRIMKSFSDGETDVLVATTVIEVGVDVPNATFMVIEDADQFGLSQLHQLRGRVGRGTHKSYCIGLFGSQLTDSGKKRLQIFRQTTDGFEIAKADLEMRGPGEFLGSRQSGIPLLRFSDFNMESPYFIDARALAKKWIEESDPRVEKQIARWFKDRENYLEA